MSLDFRREADSEGSKGDQEISRETIRGCRMKKKNNSFFPSLTPIIETESVGIIEINYWLRWDKVNFGNNNNNNNDNNLLLCLI